MIARLSGRCIHADAESIIVDVGGVGYLVRATTGVIQAALAAPDDVCVFVHTNVREDAIQLFGFASHAEQQTFERLTQLQGVGPKVAVSVLSSISPADLQRATLTEDVALLQSVPGIGPKVARRIVTELKDKLDDLVPAGGATLTAQVSDADGSATLPDAMATLYEARAALVELGMGIAEAEAALAATDPTASAQERVRQALGARRQVRA